MQCIKINVIVILGPWHPLVTINFLWVEESSFRTSGKHLLLCSIEETKSYGYWTTWGWVKEFYFWLKYLSLLNYERYTIAHVGLYQHKTSAFLPLSHTCKSDRFRFIMEALHKTLLQQPRLNLLPAVQAPHAFCMPLEQFTLSAALKGIYIFCLQWASPFFRLSEPLPPVVLPLSSLPALGLEEMKRRRKERDGLPWGALARQRSRLSELPVILYMHWMGLRSRGGICCIFLFFFVCVHFFPSLPPAFLLLHSEVWNMLSSCRRRTRSDLTDGGHEQYVSRMAFTGMKLE